MKQNRSSHVATVAMFFAAMLVIHLLTSVLFNILPFPIKPTIVHIPVIIASILYGPRVGATLGGLMGVISVVTNTIVLLPTSYLFSPFVENGNLYSLMIAMIPRILIGITPYYVYKIMKNKAGLILAGAVGSCGLLSGQHFCRCLSGAVCTALRQTIVYAFVQQGCASGFGWRCTF